MDTTNAAPAEKMTTEERVEALKAKLKEGLANITSDADWKERLRAMFKVGPLSPARLSFRNQLLLSIQAAEREEAGAPVDLSGVATFEAWKRQGRMVKKGEKALWILRPVVITKKKELEAARAAAKASGGLLSEEEAGRFSFVKFNLMALFAVSQTEGEALAETQLPELAEDAGWAEAIEAISTVARNEAGVPSITFRPRQIGDSTALGWCNVRSREIVVITDGRSRADQFATAAHELAHALLHCKQGFNPHERPAYEVEAESVAFVVCGAMGLDVGRFSFGYVTSWAGVGGTDPIKQVDESGRKISQTACLILDALGKVQRGADEKAAA